METLQRTANRGSVSTGPYQIDNSVKLEVDNNEWLYRNSPTAGNRKTFTLSLWLKRAVLGHKPAGDDEYLAGQGSNARYHFAGETIRFMFESGSTELESSRVLRDPSAWYHIVLAVDTSQGTAANRVKLYINGVQEAWNNTEYPNQNAESDWMNTNDLYIGAKWGNNSTGDGDNDLSGYLSEVVLLDGTAASPTSFGEVDEDSGIWIPIDVSGLTFGSQGFYLNFATAGDLGDDKSGNGNDLTESNLAAADQATDTPTNNFSTLNPLIEQGLIPAKYTVSEGGTKQISTVDGYGCSVGTIGVSKGKWYFEAQFTYDGGSGKHFGVIDEASFTTGTAFIDGISPGQQAYGVSMFKNGGINIDGSYDSSYSGFSAFTTETMGCAMDLDNNKLYFSKSGTYGNSGDPTSGATGTGAIPLSTAGRGTWFISTGCYTGHALTNQGGYASYSISSAASDENGYGTFEYAPPTGYYAICTKNLAEYG